MFFWLQETFRADWSPLNVFRYVSFRTLGALLTALIVTLLAYPPFIRGLQSLQVGESIRDDGPQSHQQKKGTPTMGGVLILLAVTFCVGLWGDLSNVYVLYATAIFVAFGAVGFLDDYIKLTKLRGRTGMSGKMRLVVEFLVTGTILSAFLLLPDAGGARDTTLYFPFVSVDRYSIELPIIVYGAIASFIIVGTANAVNLTDGLDGLAVGPVIVSAGTFLVLAYLTAAKLGSFDLSSYLLIPTVPGVQELAIFAAAIVGAGVGFLWYNTFPASIFMGDVGALAMGGGLGILAVFTKNEILSAIIHGVFLIETLSVVAQTTSFKLTGKRVLRMAPIHHHFEMKGWAEPKIIVRCWILSLIFALLALSSLKLR